MSATRLAGIGCLARRSPSSGTQAPSSASHNEGQNHRSEVPHHVAYSPCAALSRRLQWIRRIVAFAAPALAPRIRRHTTSNCSKATNEAFTVASKVHSPIHSRAEVRSLADTKHLKRAFSPTAIRCAPRALAAFEIQTKTLPPSSAYREARNGPAGDVGRLGPRPAHRLSKEPIRGAACGLIRSQPRLFWLTQPWISIGPRLQARATLSPFASVLNRIWPEGSSQTTSLTAPDTKALGRGLYNLLQTLSPHNDIQRRRQSDALQLLQELGQTRWLLAAQLESRTVPLPFLKNPRILADGSVRQLRALFATQGSVKTSVLQNRRQSFRLEGIFHYTWLFLRNGGTLRKPAQLGCVDKWDSGRIPLDSKA